MVDSRIINPFSAKCPLMASKICRVSCRASNSCRSLSRASRSARIFGSGQCCRGAYGLANVDRSSIPSSDKPKHCLATFMRSMRTSPIEGLTGAGGLGIRQLNRCMQFAPERDTVNLGEEAVARCLSAEYVERETMMM